jgi:hypothetical protein
MRTFEFYLLFSEHTVLYLFLWAVIFIVYRLLFWKTVKSIFDPIYFTVIFTNSICTANVIFLSVLCEIRYYYTYAYLLSECALIAGILLLSRQQPVIDQSPAVRTSVQRLNFGIFLSIGLAICANFIIYAERGIPILLESRNDSSGGGSGFGLLTRLSDTATSIFVLFYFAKSKITASRNSKIDHLLFCISIVFGLLNGYKAFFIYYLFAFFITRGRTKTNSKKRDLLTILSGSAVIFALFAVVFDSTDFGIIFPLLMSRVLASGDVYYMAFVNDTINVLPSQTFFYQLFGALLASFRLISWDQGPLNYGYVINEVVNKNSLLLGPTFRYNVLWLLLTKSIFLTTLLSLLVGLVIGAFNRALYGRTKLNFTFLFLAFVYYRSFILILGPDHGISNIFLSVSILALIYAVVLFPLPYKKLRPQNYRPTGFDNLQELRSLTSGGKEERSMVDVNMTELDGTIEHR